MRCARRRYAPGHKRELRTSGRFQISQGYGTPCSSGAFARPESASVLVGLVVSVSLAEGMGPLTLGDSYRLREASRRASES